MEKKWKNICFPILTPIYTKYRENFKEKSENFASGVIGDESILED
jgi:hypothetical protein